jgi:type I restriction enzyme, S subunit
MNVSEDGGIELRDLKYVPRSAVTGEQYLLRRDDVLFNNTNSSELVGKTACYDLEEPRAFSNHMTRLRCRSEVLMPRYCAVALHQLWREGYFQNVCNNHVSQASVGRTVLLETEIPIPPIHEQERIVARAEDLFHVIRKSRNRLASVPTLLKRFRQAVLAAACSGKLTEDWRNSSSQTETAEELLSRILRDRRDMSNKSRQRQKEPLAPTDEPKDAMPTGWEMATVDQLTQLVTSGSRGWPQYYSDSGPLFIRAENINKDYLGDANIAHVRPPKRAEGSRTRVQVSDLLVTITGANVTKSAIVNRELGEAYVSQHVGLVRPVERLTADYLYLWIISPAHGRSKLVEDAYGAGKPGLNLDNIREMNVMLPPMEEQREIVQRVEVLFKLADAIEKRVGAATLRAEKLTQAILAKAFRGELVPTEAELAKREGREYESASVLLERIRAERAKTISVRPQKRKARAARQPAS